jgi:hypothetical protein
LGLFKDYQPRFETSQTVANLASVLAGLASVDGLTAE